MNNYLSAEQMLIEITSKILQLNPDIDLVKTKNEISKIINNYNISPISQSNKVSDLADKITLFLNAKKLEGLSENTIEGYNLELRIFAEKVNKNSSEITPGDIRVFLSDFTNHKTSTISRKLSVLKSFFGWLTIEELIERDPTLKVKVTNKEERLPKALTIEELELLRESCSSVRQRVMLELLYATGCRLSEIHSLNISDINLQNKSCRVIGKGNKEREVFLSPKAIFHLSKYLGMRKDNEEALMITERKPYRRLTKRGIQREIMNIAKLAGLEKKVSPVTLRHTFATLTLNNGAELAAVQALLGHVDPSSTLVYANVTNEMKREQYNKHLVQ